jgi:hypothetical protein
MKTKLLILGYARHGKDTVAELLRDHEYGLRFVSSSYFLAEKVCRPYLAERGVTYPDLEACYADRVNHRAAWHDAIADWNREDPALLSREILKVADVYVGMRADREYQVAKGLFDMVIWVDSSERGLPPEDKSSMDIEFAEGEMRWLPNNGTIEDLKDRIDELVSDLKAIGWGRAMASI